MPIAAQHQFSVRFVVGALIAGVGAWMIPAAFAQPVDLPVPAASADKLPSGIKVTRSAEGSVYVNARGKVLYGMDMRTLLYDGPDPAQHCTGTCLEEWEPFLAPRGSRPNIVYPRGNHDRVQTQSQIAAEAEIARQSAASQGATPTFYTQPQKAPDWTVIAGPQGPQWVYKGWHLVFTVRGAGARSTRRDGEGSFTWNTLKYVPPAPTVTAPPGVRPDFVDGAYVLSDRDGRILYSGACADRCDKWQAFTGGMAGAPIGDWRVSLLTDSPQWTYRGKPVFVSSASGSGAIPAGGAALRP